MEAQMRSELEIGFAPETLRDGSPEERATYGLFTMIAPRGSLTEGWDHYLEGSRAGPLVSAYPAAEWFVWFWWRLRWEPRRTSREWDFAHRMNNIGDGYIWPNVTIFSDGERTALLSQPSENPDAKPFRFFGGLPVILPSKSFESAVDSFVGQVLSRLESNGVKDSNLSRLWEDLLAERSDREVSLRRRLEAMLARDPDEIEDEAVEQLIADAAQLGLAAIEELAAQRGQPGKTTDQAFTAKQIRSVAKTVGFDASPRDAAELHSVGLPSRTDVPAWKLGTVAAQSLRQQENLGVGKIQNARLAALAGTTREVLVQRSTANEAMSFALDENSQRSRIVLRSKWEGGRRFDLARLLGDRLLNQEGKLHPATRTFTYRQKAQRSFAAELLSPFDAVDDMMAGDYSPEMQQDVADYFAVSPMTINTLLKNHGRIERDDDHLELAAVA